MSYSLKRKLLAFSPWKIFVTLNAVLIIGILLVKLLNGSH